jgi:MoxR-like ATPase
VSSWVDDPVEVGRRMDRVDYLVDEGLATALSLALTLGLPLLLEGEPGVGKTAAARALARAAQTELIRLQCYEGLTASEALYEWNYQRQLLAIRLAESRHETLADADLFTEEFLQERPILRAVRFAGPEPPVLLIDEIDRADDEFEAFLLEFLADFAVTIPELGTITAARRPTVFLTSNRTRELHDALKRRCLYQWIDYPSPELEREIVRTRIPGVPEAIASRVVTAVSRLREQGDLYKLPGVGETIVWARALLQLGEDADLEETLGVALKVHEDMERVISRGVLDGV